MKEYLPPEMFSAILRGALLAAGAFLSVAVPGWIMGEPVREFVGYGLLSAMTVLGIRTGVEGVRDTFRSDKDPAGRLTEEERMMVADSRRGKITYIPDPQDPPF